MSRVNDIRIAVENVSFGYSGGNILFRNVSFCVREREIVSILGPSGCGKSTLLKLVAGTLRPIEGTITVQPATISEVSGGVSHISQAPMLIPWRTALQNATIDIELQGSLLSASEMRIRNDFQKFGLGGSEDLFPDELSGGMKQRISVIRALSTDPSVMYADEPFSALDYFSRIQANVLFKEQCSLQRTATLFITHNIEEAIYLSDQIIILSKSGEKIPAVLRLNKQLGWESHPIEFRQTDEFRDTVREIWDIMEVQLRD